MWLGPTQRTVSQSQLEGLSSVSMSARTSDPGVGV
jgi:hypothetical protein